MNIYYFPFLSMQEELVTALAQGRHVRVERIISTGQTSDWYDQDEAELVILIEGQATIEYEGGRTTTLSKGDILLILPHEKHRVSYTSSEPACIWICVFFSE